MGLIVFREEIVNYKPINDYLKATLLGMIAVERQNEIIEWIDLKNACQMLIALGLDNRDYYESQFESHFMRESAEFYSSASQKFLLNNSASVYVQKVNECLREEINRSERYLDKITEGKIIQVLNDVLISKHLRVIVEMENSGLVHMLINNKIAGK